MKKIKLFIFTLCAMFVAVISVSAQSVNDANSLNICILAGGECTLANDIEVNDQNFDIDDLDDANWLTADKDLVLDLANHKLTFSDDFDFEVQGNGITVVVKNGTIEQKSDGEISAIYVFDGKLKTENLTVDVSGSVKGGKGRKVPHAFYISGSNEKERAELEVSADTTINSKNGYGLVLSSHAGAILNGTWNTAKSVIVGADVLPTGASIGADPTKTTIVTINGGYYNATTGVTIPITRGNWTFNGGNFVSNDDDVIHIDEMPVDKNGNPKTEALVVKMTGGHYESKDTSKKAVNAEDLTSFISGGQYIGMTHTNHEYLVSGYEYLDNGLVVTDADYSNLNGALSVAKGIDTSKYTATSVKALLQAIEDAENVEKGLKSNEQYKIDNLTKALTTAIANLVEKGNEPVKPGSDNPSNTDEEDVPNTFDAGLTYIGLALSAIGTSVFSIKKLRNN